MKENNPAKKNIIQRNVRFLAFLGFEVVFVGSMFGGFALVDQGVKNDIKINSGLNEKNKPTIVTETVTTTIFVGPGSTQKSK